MEIKKYKKILLLSIISIAFSLLFTYCFWFFLNKNLKKNIFIEIKDIYANQKFIFYNNEEEQLDIDFYKTLNETENILLSSNLSSEVYALNYCEEDYTIKNELFYKVLNDCKEIYYCSSKTFAPMLYNISDNNIIEKEFNTTNFDCILINKNKIKKIYPKTKINLDQFIDACCLYRILGNNKNLHNFYLQKDGEIFVSGNQNNFTKGWNLLKRIIIENDTNTTTKNDIDEDKDSLKNVDIQEIEENIEKLLAKIKTSPIYIKNPKFDLVTFAQKSNDILELSQIISLKNKILKNKEDISQNITTKKKEETILKFKGIKNKAIAVIESKDMNKIQKRDYGLQDSNKKNYEIQNYFINAKTKTFENPTFIIGFVFADNNILAKALSTSLGINNFQDADNIINRIRYHRCQYFVLYANEDGEIEYEHSSGLKVKKIEDYYDISFYE